MIKIEFIDGQVETIENGILLNGDDDNITEYQIRTDDGVKHFPLDHVKTLMEVD